MKLATLTALATIALSASVLHTHAYEAAPPAPTYHHVHTDGSAKECQDAIGFYTLSVEEMKKARGEHPPFKTIDDLNAYLDNIRSTASTTEMLALTRMIHAVDDLDCSNLDDSFTNYLMADVLAIRRMADEMQKKLTPTFNQTN